MSANSVDIHFVRSTLAVAKENGVSATQLLQESRISPELLRLDTSRVTAVQARDLMQALWRISGDELLGLGPQQVPRGTFEMICLTLIHCSDLRSALTRMLRFLAISTGIGPMRIKEANGTVTLTVNDDVGNPLHPMVTEILLALIQRFSAWLIGRRINLAALEMPFSPPAHADEYDSIFGRQAQFGLRAAISFDARWLSAPIVRDESDLMDFLKNAPADLLFRRDYGTTVSYKVRKILEHAEANSLETADAVAARLTISTQHMRRLLQSEGTSFRQVRDDVLRDAAISSLVRNEESVEALSSRLGFSEPSAFRRAFTRWTGTTPSTYKTQGVHI